MIGMSIALGIWTSGLIWIGARAEKKRLMLSQETADTKEENVDPGETHGIEDKV